MLSIEFVSFFMHPKIHIRLLLSVFYATFVILRNLAFVFGLICLLFSPLSLMPTELIVQIIGDPWRDMLYSLNQI
jgi:hypothetical protein